jgi:hypothetical protein
MHIGYWWESQTKRDHWVDQDIGGWTTLKWIERQDGMVWIELIWLSIGTNGGLLWTWYWTSSFHKMLGSSWVAAQLVASQEGLSSMSKKDYFPESLGFNKTVVCRMFSAVVTQTMLDAECSRHMLTPLFSAVVTQTHTGSCWPWKGPLMTNRWCGLEVSPLRGGHAGWS